MNPQLFHDLAASEESSGYPDNARALRAVPGILTAFRQVLFHIEHRDGLRHRKDLFTDCELASWRAALAALDAPADELPA